LHEFRDEIERYDEIRHDLPLLTYILTDMNTLAHEIHCESGFEELIKAIEQRLAEYA